MQQPALGQRILALRQEKGLTQEELVAECNISVRTIQRIEAGEVSPRTYTIKTILAAMGEDFSEFTESAVESGLKRALFLKIDDSQQATILVRNLKIAWVAGIVYFVLGFIELPADAYRMFETGTLYPPYLHIALKISILMSLLLFLRGFILTGNILNNYLLKVVVFIMLVFSVAYYTLDIASLYFDSIDLNMILIAESVAFGIVGILMGIAMLRLKTALGNIALITGIFEIVTYACFLTVVLAIGGSLLLLPTTILEIIMLYKVAQLVKDKVNS